MGMGSVFPTAMEHTGFTRSRTRHITSVEIQIDESPGLH